MTQRVLFVTYAFPPSLEMGAHACAQIARYLPLYGWQPLVLTIRDKHIVKEYLLHSETLETDWRGSVIKTGVLPHPLDFHRWTKSLLSLGKPSVAEILGPDSATSSKNAHLRQRHKGRLRTVSLSLLGIPDFNSGWLIPGTIAGLRAIRNKNPQMIFSSAPPFTTHLIGYVLAQLTGLPWVIHFRDPWATAAPTEKIPLEIPLRLNLALERIVVNRADGVVCVTEEHSAKLCEAYPTIAADKFSSVPNGFDPEEWKDIDLERTNTVQTDESPNNKFGILYAGQFYGQRNPIPLFRALQSLIDSGKIARERLQVDLLGWCEVSEGLSVFDLITEMNLQDCVNIVGPKSRPETLRRMTQSDLLLILAEGWTTQIPGKSYEYLKAGRPILALTSQGALANFIRKTGAGWSIDPANHEAIKSAVNECYKQWEAGRMTSVPDSATVARFDRRATTGQIGKLFDQLVALKLKC